MKNAWLIEYQTCSKPCWIATRIENNSFGVTYSPGMARQFDNEEAAKTEIHELKLSREWQAVERTVSS